MIQKFRLRHVAAAIFVAALIGVSLTASQAPARTAASPAARDYQVEDWKLQVSLIPEKTSFMLGEPIYLSFTVHNSSTADLQIIAGGDTSNPLGRPERFNVETVRDDGVRVPIPESRDGFGNSAVGPQRLPANGSYSFSLFLSDWAALKEPGKYTMTAARTLDVRAYDRNDMSWRDPATLSHLDVQASAVVSVVPVNRTALGESIVARARVMLNPTADMASETAARAVARALAALDDERTIEPFSRAVAESGYSVKFIAVGALAKFNSDAALAALKQAARDPDDNIRHAAAIALSKSPHPGAVNALLAMGTDTSFGVRNDVLQALAKMHSAESLELIRQMTNDVDGRVRTEAQRYLKLRTDAAGVDGLLVVAEPMTSTFASGEPLVLRDHLPQCIDAGIAPAGSRRWIWCVAPAGGRTDHSQDVHGRVRASWRRCSRGPAQRTDPAWRGAIEHRHLQELRLCGGHVGFRQVWKGQDAIGHRRTRNSAAHGQ